MPAPTDPGALPADFSPEQQAVWQRVNQLWALAVKRDDAAITAALHPDFLGWDLRLEGLHDRSAAVGSVSGPSRILAYTLRPLGVQVYAQRVGIVHYTYSATVRQGSAPPAAVTGRWTEVYLRQAGEWLLVAVSGRPD